MRTVNRLHLMIVSRSAKYKTFIRHSTLHYLLSTFSLMISFHGSQFSPKFQLESTKQKDEVCVYE